jgi:uncharacterized protein YdhG (YjbR/CyaY superfamily)
MTPPSDPTSQTSVAGFSAAERAAMKQRAAELRAEVRSEKGAKQAADDAAGVLAKIAAMAQPDRGLAERIHSLVLAAAPHLAPKVWYGQPGYAKDGKLVCFFRSGLGDKERYSTFGFSSKANLDDEGGLWPTSYALTELNDASAATLSALVARAAS